MTPSNPAVYECGATASKIHTWLRRDNGTGYCLKCNTELTVVQMDEVRQGVEMVRCTTATPRV